jgi:hypothetical protein
MEPTERYDPEDLEHLMLERRFDELLEEERAYALRHLADRAEYERMRALLLHVREDRTAQGTMDAPPKVREHVLQAFRDQQKPQWKIWLNSVGGFLMPEQPAQYWRPALALGTVAVLVFASLLTLRNMETDGNKVLAELKEVKNEAPAEPVTPAVAETVGGLMDTNSASVDTRTTASESAPMEPAQAPGQYDSEAKQNAIASVVEPASHEQDASAIGRVEELAETQKYDNVQSNETARAKTAERERTQPAGGAVLQNPAIADEAEDDLAKASPKLEKATPPPMPTQATTSGTYDGSKNSDKKLVAAAPKEDELLGLLRAAW